MADPIHTGETSLLTLEVRKRNLDQVEVKIQAKVNNGEVFPLFTLEHGHQLTGLTDALNDSFGLENCRTESKLDHRLVTVTRPRSLHQAGFPAAVVMAVQSVESNPAIAEGVSQFQMIDDPEHIAKLVDGAMQHSNQHRQVRHILADDSLSHEQRREALDMLHLMRDKKKRGLE